MTREWSDFAVRESLEFVEVQAFGMIFHAERPHRIPAPDDT
jgi:hypothetical protein